MSPRPGQFAAEVGQYLLLLEQIPVVALLGPRQAGKTTLALELAKSLTQEALYLDLEHDSDRSKSELLSRVVTDIRS
jgi:predicted AAA+ superfamily ATPase